jgi:diaminopimelate decarboxylase
MLLGSQTIEDDGHLWIGGCDSVALAREYDTPLYVIDEDGARDTCRRYIRAFEARRPGTEVAYACKAFAVGAMLELVVHEGLGLDVVSEGELALALHIAIPPHCVTVHGNYKSDSQIQSAVDSGVGRIVLDSLGEAARVAAAARRAGRRQRVLVRLNPGVCVDTNTKYNTGGADSKFGLSLEDGSARHGLVEALAEDALETEGVHFHLGSQIRTPAPYLEAMARTARFLRDAPAGWRPRRVVVGGGMAARYGPGDSPPTPEMWADSLGEGFDAQLLPQCDPHVTMAIEPGRAISAENGLTLYTVGPVKVANGHTKPIDVFAAVDGGLSDNPRSILCAAQHQVQLASAAAAPAAITAEICGRHCGNDTLFPAVNLPDIRPGDILAVKSTGAYTHCMASNYNRFPRPAVVFVSGGRSQLVIRRETIADLMRTELRGSAPEQSMDSAVSEAPA